MKAIDIFIFNGMLSIANLRNFFPAAASVPSLFVFDFLLELAFSAQIMPNSYSTGNFNVSVL